MEISKNIEELEAELGRQLLDLRLRKNINQRELSARAGIALNAVKNLENGNGATVTSLIKVLRTLERAEWLLSLAPVVSISPLQMLRSRSKPVRQRASKSKGSPRV